ncbi:hypothetical protein CR513_16066, partial [Mucuna pruriens]
MDPILNVLTIDEPEQMENNDQIWKELATPDMYPQLELAQTYELKPGLIYLLPRFHGLVGEDPHKHIKEFHMACSTMRSQGIPEDYIKMKAFPFSLGGLVVSAVGSLQHLGRYEVHISREVLFGITNCDHLKRNLLDKATF